MCRMISICPAELISCSPVERFGADPYNGGEELCMSAKSALDL